MWITRWRAKEEQTAYSTSTILSPYISLCLNVNADERQLLYAHRTEFEIENVFISQSYKQSTGKYKKWFNCKPSKIQLSKMWTINTRILPFPRSPVHTSKSSKSLLCLKTQQINFTGMRATIVLLLRGTTCS